MKKIGATKYPARKYVKGSSDAEFIAVRVKGAQLHFVSADGEVESVPMSEVDLRLGGSHHDRAVFVVHKTNDTIITNNLEILHALNDANTPANLKKAMAGIKTARLFATWRQHAMMICVVLVCLMFGGCVFIGTVLEPMREANEPQTQGSQTGTNGSSQETEKQNATQSEGSEDEQSE
ncbi:MAG: hypothetical protein K2Z81_13025 [Cyanobacteria bacterium]|nr:hypothetical protein [Cyanobacteriota bacterium]